AASFASGPSAEMKAAARERMPPGPPLPNSRLSLLQLRCRNRPTAPAPAFRFASGGVEFENQACTEVHGFPDFGKGLFGVLQLLSVDADIARCRFRFFSRAGTFGRRRFTRADPTESEASYVFRPQRPTDGGPEFAGRVIGEGPQPDLG